MSDIRGAVWKTLYNLLYVRLVLTAILVAWGTYISWRYNTTNDPVLQEKLKYMNFVWNGTGRTGIFMTVFWIWVLTLAAVAAYPIIYQIFPEFFEASKVV